MSWAEWAPWAAGAVVAAGAAALAATGKRASLPPGPQAWPLTPAFPLPEGLSPSAGYLPAGPGIIQYDWRRTGGPARWAERIRSWGSTWVRVQTTRQRSDGSIIRIPMEPALEHVAAAREAGLGVTTWGWPDPSDPERYAAAAGEAAAELGATAHVINAERPWHGASGRPLAWRRARAESMVESLRQAMGQRSIGMSSYPAPASHPNFPWGEFTELDFGCPMVYSVRFTPADVLRFCRAYSAMYPGGVYPIAAASTRYRPSEIRDAARRIPAGLGTLQWWSYNNIIVWRSIEAAVGHANLEWGIRQTMEATA